MNGNYVARYRRFFLPVLLILGLWLVVRGYYQPYFSSLTANVLALVFLFFLVTVFYLGTKLFSVEASFPGWMFLAATAVITLVRWLYTYFFLQRHLPPETVFHYPERAIWFLVPTSAVFLFAGYALKFYRHAKRAEIDKSVLSFRDSGREIRLPAEELIHVQANGEYLIYHCTDRRYQRFQRLKEAETELKPLGFVRVHRSHIVAWSAVRSRSASELRLSNGTVVPVSKTYRSRVADKMKK